MDKWLVNKRKSVDEAENIREKRLKGSDSNNNNKSTPSSLSRVSHLNFWTESQWNEKFETNNWLTVKESGLGCTICISAGNLGQNKTQGLKLANEWVNCTVREYGGTKEKKQQSIRKKLSSHKLSTAHIKVCEIMELAKKQQIESSISKSQSQHYETTNRIFKTVYYIVKNNRPFGDLPNLIDLQEANGIKMGLILQSDHSCSEIALHIADEMRKKLVIYILENDLKIGILIDESTTTSNKCALTVCLRVKMPESSFVNSIFFDLIELENTTASTITEKLFDLLQNHGFNDNFLFRNWISFACDGASNMIGRKTGVASRICNKFPNIIIWHCSNHRLELAVNEIVNQISPVCHMKKFFDKLYALYNSSPKNKRDLENVAQELGVKLKSIGRILDTRWVSSSARSIMAVWNNYKALYSHFLAGSQDQSRSKKTRLAYEDLKKTLCDKNYVHNMGLMLDALLELEQLSKKLQLKNISLPEAHKLIVLKYHVFQSMTNNPGEYYEMSIMAIEKQYFKGVELENGQVTKIDGNVFFKKLSENISLRMFTTRASHMSSSNTEESELNKEKYKELINNLEIFDETKWPEEKTATFGDQHIRKLARQFNLCESTSVQGFRQFHMSENDSNNKTIPEDLKKLKSSIDTIVISTAECERSFSTMNLILTDIRNALKIATVSSLMFIKMGGPPLKTWNPSEYVKTWLKKGKRDADCINCCQRLSKKVDDKDQLWKLF